MAKLKITFDERKFKRELEKQLKKEVNRISSQIDADQMKINDSGEFTMLNKMQEDMLKTILECYDGNESLEVNGSYQVFPKYMKLSIKEAMMQLKSRGLIASFNNFLNGWSIFLTPNGIHTLKTKKKEREKICHYLLSYQVILDSYYRKLSMLITLLNCFKRNLIKPHLTKKTNCFGVY